MGRIPWSSRLIGSQFSGGTPSGLLAAMRILYGFGRELWLFARRLRKFVGRALNLRRPGDLAGSYVTAGAVAAGAGGVQLQNANGVILQLSGARVGAEVSAAVGGVTITMQAAPAD